MAAIRKITIPVPKPGTKTAAKPAKVDPHAASNKLIANAIKNSPALAKMARVEVPAKPKREAVARVAHEVVSPYTGPSLGLNKRKSITALDLATFGTKPDYVLTERTEAVGRALRAKYGSTPFERANADAGILKYLGMKGYIEHVAGEAHSEKATFRFTKEGLKHLPASV